MNIKKKGFTLIELLVVVAIISMLTSITLSALGDAKQKGRDTEKIRAVQEIKSALQLYATDKGGFPGAISSSVTALTNELVNASKPYISKIHKNILYRGVGHNGAACDIAQQPCLNYHLAIVLERRDNPVLKSDANTIMPSMSSASKIYGKNDTCLYSGAPSADPALCYDVEP